MRPKSIIPIRPDLDIAVVYTHERDLMPKLLSSLAASGDGLRMRLLLIDNVSAEGGDEYRRYFPDTIVMRNEKRLFYGANLNRAIRASTARYLLMLNTDMFFDPPEQCLARMIEFMDEQPDCGISGCRLYRGDGEFAFPARRFQTLPLILARRLGLARLLRNTVDRHFYRERSIHEAWPCDWLSGCFMLVRREAINDVGFLDEGFVKYFEDVDLCLRMARAGWRVMYNGGTYGYHLEERGSKRLFSADARRHLKSYLHWLWKWGFSPEHQAAAAPAALRRAA
ncbi:MAG: glycosyltransferase family 2 protein [Pirellulales bacterium]|nr:glycosyltransferase family 2 protein [Pirellulales bacterium]